MLHALVNRPSPLIEQCEVSYIDRTPIDYDLSLRQHEAYCRALEQCGAKVRRLEINRDFPDGVFVEDTAIVLDELAILCSPGAASRRGEVDAIEPVLAEYRPVERIKAPATLDGGDVLRMGKTLFVGVSKRTNRKGVAALRRIAGKRGYAIVPIELRNCLHFKSACTCIDDSTVLVNPEWIDLDPLADYNLIPIPAEEPWGADVLRIGPRVIASQANPRTADLIAKHGIEVVPVDVSEFHKAEGAVTCLSLVFEK